MREFVTEDGKIVLRRAEYESLLERADRGHDYYDPTGGDGGLAACHKCGGAERTLPTFCPGEKMTEGQAEAVYSAKLDYIHNRWVAYLGPAVTREALQVAEEPPSVIRLHDDNYDVGEFHRKFGLHHTNDAVFDGRGARALDVDTLYFRVRFLLEELSEYCEAVGVTFKYELATWRPDNVKGWCTQQDLAKAFDALIDLVYVAHGNAHLHGFPWNEGWREVQRANMSKERCEIDHRYQQGIEPDSCVYLVEVTDGRRDFCGRPRVKHSVRGSANDVIKPAGWTAPDIAGLLARHRRT